MQITPEIRANNRAINLISTHAARVRKHDYYNSPAPRNLASNTTCNLQNLNYVDPALQVPLITSLAQHSTTKYKQLVQKRRARLKFLTLTSHQYGDIPEIILKVTNHK